MMMSVPNQPDRTFDVEELQTTLRKLQEAMRTVSQVRRNLEQEEAVAYGGVRSRRFESRLATYSRNLGSVSTYVDDDERACCSSRSLRFSMSSDDHIAQPRRAARSPNLIAKLMGLEDQTPMYVSRRSEISVKCEICAQTAVSKGGLLANNGDEEDCKNIIPSSFGTTNSHIRKLQEKVWDNAQILSRRGLERKEVWRREKPHEARSLKNSVAALAGVSKQQQQRKMSKPLLHGKKLPAVKTEKEIIAVSTSEAKRSTGAPGRLDKRSLLPKGANAPKRHNLATTTSKKEKEAKAARKSMDIIQVTGRTTNNGVTNINQSHASLVDTLPKHMEQQNSKQCNTGGRGRKDSKHFCEVIVKTTVKGGRNSTSSSSEASGEFRSHNIRIQREEATLTVVDIKLLLLSSQSFINYAQELCRLDGNQITTYHPKKGLVVPTRNAKLLLDCARELVDRKSKHQALESSSRSRAVVGVDKLAEEIANEISKLEVPRRRDGRRGEGEGVNSEDRTYEMLEMDLGCNNGLLNAMWDEGWMEWICVEEVDYVVAPLEKMVLCGLVEELVLDLLL